MTVSDCVCSTGSARAANRAPKGGSGGLDEVAGLAVAYSFSYRSLEGLGAGVAERFGFELLGEELVKGRSRPVTVHALVGRGGR